MRGPVETIKRWWKGGDGNGKSHATDVHGNGKPGSNGDTRRLWSLRRAKRPGSAPSREPRWFRQWDANNIPHTLTYPSTTLGRMIDQTADRFGDAVAVVYH